MKNSMNIFAFYNWIQTLKKLKYIKFVLYDNDFGIEYKCYSKREVINTLCSDNRISMNRLYRKEYNVTIYAVHCEFI